MKGYGRLDGEGGAAANRGLVTLRIIWGAMLFSLAIYLFMGLMLGRSLQPSLAGTETMSILRAVLYGVAVLELFLALFIRRRMLAVGREGIALQAAMARYASAVIVSLALSESIGIYGLVLFLTGGDRTDLFSLIALAAGAMIFYRPRVGEVLAMTGASRDPMKEYQRGEGQGG